MEYLVISDLPEADGGSVQIFAAVVSAGDELEAIQKFASGFGSEPPARAYAVAVGDLPERTITATPGVEIS